MQGSKSIAAASQHQATPTLEFPPARSSQLLHGNPVHRERKSAFALVRDHQADFADLCRVDGRSLQGFARTVGISNASGASRSVHSPAVVSNSAPQDTEMPGK